MLKDVVSDIIFEKNEVGRCYVVVGRGGRVGNGELCYIQNGI